MSKNLSVMIMTWNSAALIRPCLESVKWADEIVVIDSNSTDETVAIAREYTDKIIVTPDWPGPGVQRNRALAQCTGEWVLCVDADERVTSELRASIEMLMQNPGKIVAAAIPMRVFFLNHPIQHGTWKSTKTFFFRREKGRFAETMVHEALLFSGKSIRLKGYLDHYSYNSFDQVLEKMCRYSSFAAEERFRQGKKISFGKILVRCAWSFIRSYILYAGFLDGKAGFVVAVLDAQESYYRGLKLLERLKQF